MNYLFIATSALSLFTIVLFIRTFRKTSLKTVFQNAKNGKVIEEKRKQAVANGKQEFTFERGTVVIYAKTQARAIYEYNEFKKKRKEDWKKLKSV